MLVHGGKMKNANDLLGAILTHYNSGDFYKKTPLNTSDVIVDHYTWRKNMESYTSSLKDLKNKEIDENLRNQAIELIKDHVVDMANPLDARFFAGLIRVLKLKECGKELLLLMADPIEDIRNTAREAAKELGYDSIKQLFETFPKNEQKDVVKTVEDYLLNHLCDELCVIYPESERMITLAGELELIGCANKLVEMFILTGNETTKEALEKMAAYINDHPEERETREVKEHIVNQIQASMIPLNTKKLPAILTLLHMFKHLTEINLFTREQFEQLDPKERAEQVLVLSKLLPGFVKRGEVKIAETLLKETIELIKDNTIKLDEQTKREIKKTVETYFYSYEGEKEQAFALIVKMAKNPKYLPKVAALLDRKDADVRRAAKEALEEIGREVKAGKIKLDPTTKKTLKNLVVSFSDSFPHISGVWAAVFIMGELNVVANEYVDYLCHRLVKSMIEGDNEESKFGEEGLIELGKVLMTGKATLNPETYDRLKEDVDTLVKKADEKSVLIASKIIRILRMRNSAKNLIFLMADPRKDVKEAAEEAAKELNYDSIKQIYTSLPKNEQREVVEMIKEYAIDGKEEKRRISLVLIEALQLEKQCKKELMFLMADLKDDDKKMAEKIAKKLRYCSIEGIFNSLSKNEKNEVLKTIKHHDEKTAFDVQYMLIVIAKELKLVETIPQIFELTSISNVDARASDEDKNHITNLAKTALNQLAKEIKEGNLSWDEDVKNQTIARIHEFLEKGDVEKQEKALDAIDILSLNEYALNHLDLLAEISKKPELKERVNKIFTVIENEIDAGRLAKNAVNRLPLLIRTLDQCSSESLVRILKTTEIKMREKEILPNEETIEQLKKMQKEYITKISVEIDELIGIIGEIKLNKKSTSIGLRNHRFFSKNRNAGKIKNIGKGSVLL